MVAIEVSFTMPVVVVSLSELVVELLLELLDVVPELLLVEVLELLLTGR